jgi:uncharacterized protein (TIGR03435 family)
MRIEKGDWISAISAAGIAVLSALNVAAQEPTTRNQFEVVSIRPSTLSDPHSFRVNSSSPGTLNIEYPIALLLRVVLNVKAFQIVGLPAWADTANYAFVGKTTQPAALRGMWPLLLPVLEERFHLQFHRENRELPVYELSVSKAGKLLSPQSKNCYDPSGPLPPPVRVPLGQRLPVPCGEAILTPLPPGGSYLYGSAVTIATVASHLTDVLGRPVVDKTGIADRFDLDLKFARDDSTRGLPAGPDAANPSDLPDLFTALQNQLGLKAKSAKDPVEVIVIDHIEKPSEN